MIQKKIVENFQEEDQERFGVLYLAFGQSYLAMALLSASTLRKTNPEIPICIIVNIKLKTKNIDFWDSKKDFLIYLEKDTLLNRNIKVSLNKYTPFKKTLFLDCDTLVIGNISKTELYLDYFDIAIKLNPFFKTLKGKGDVPVIDDKTTASDIPHWNSGVIMFRKNEKTNLFFKKWSDLYKKLNVSYDQVSLAEAIFKSDIKLLSLNSEWNYSSSLLSKNKNILVVHYTSKISDKIASQIFYYNNTINNNFSEIKRFIKEKRQHRKNKDGIIRYLLLRIKWKMELGIFFINNIIKATF